MSKKLISLLLSLLLVLGAVGVPVGADAGATTPAETVTITLKPNGGTPNINQEFVVNKGDSFTPKDISDLTPAIKAPIGKTFLGWGRESNPNTKLNFPITATDNLTLVAIWIDEEYTVTFDLNGGIGTAPTSKVNYNGTYGTLPADPTRSGYKFNGWYTAETGGTKVTSSTKVATAANHSVYAQWLAVHEITFEPGDGTLKDTDKKKTFIEGERFSLPTPTAKTGSTFVGWFDSSNNQLINGSVVPATMPNKSFSAKYTQSEYTVTLDPAGGTGLTKTTFSINYGQVYKVADTENLLTTTLARTGYTFDAWYTKANGAGTKIEDNTTHGVTSNQILYANWTPNNYSISYDYAFPTPAACAWKGPDDQYTTTPPTTTPTPSPVTYNSTYPALPTPAPSDVPYYSEGSEKKYTFEGWYAKAEDTINSTDPTKSDICKEINGGTNGDIYTLTDAKGQKLFARWGYEIEFFANNTADPTTETPIGTLKCVTGKAYDVGKMPKEPTRAGYTFAGWYAGREDVAAKVDLNAFTTADAKNKTLYAHWTNASYQVTLDPNGGALVAGTSDKIDVKYQEAYPALPDPAKRKGYTFDGWYTAKDGGTKIVVDNLDPTKNTIVTKTQDHVLYAHWKAEKATLTVDYRLPDDFDNTDNKYPPLTGKLDIGQDLSVAGLPEKKPVPYYYGDPKIKFEFDEWYTTADDSIPGEKGSWVNPQTPLTADMVDADLKITLYARWSMPVGLCNNYDGKATETTHPDNTLEFVMGSAYGSKLPTPTRTGYTFMGWFTKPGDDGVQKTATDIAKREVTKLYARWTTSAYVVTLDPTDGAFSEEQKIRSEKFNHNDPYGDFLTKYIPTAPAGHTFDGWYTEKEGGRKLTASDRVTKGGTIYAHWKADQFKVTLKLNYSGAADTVKTVDYGTELKKVLPASEPERAGYAFLGWFTDESFTTPADPEEKIAANMTIYAQWKEGKRVDLVVGGGKLPENTHSYIYVYDGGTFNKLPTPTWPGCIFGGWWTAATGGEQVTVATPAGANPPAALYARWTPKQVIVHLDYNGAPNLPSLHREYSIGSPYTGLPTYASWPGHEFMGWYTRSAAGEKIESSTLVSVASDEVEEFTIYAHWGYKVSFDPMEGTGEMDQQTAEMNQHYTLPTCTFTPPDGMRFGGWAIGTPDGPKQAGGSQYTVNRHLTLYATWTTAPIVITSSCTPGGSLMTEDGKANEVTVERGTDVTFVAAANTGYVLKELLVDGVNFNYTDVYTFRNVIEDHVIHAAFVPEGAPAYSTCGHGSSCPLAKYRDMTPGAWYHDGVHFCIDNVIMGGTGDGVFSPNSRATRAEVATTLWNYAGRPPIAGSGALPRTYKDVKPSAWYYQAVEWATKEGLLSGYGDSTFRPNNYITREELVSILWHHAGQPKARQTGLRFYDAWQVSNWAWDAMLWATEEGVISGRSFGYLVPKGNATRAEVATMLKNYLG